MPNNNRGRVVNSYSVCSVSGQGDVGGLIGRNGYLSDFGIIPSSFGSIVNCYSAGLVHSVGDAGGLVGTNPWGQAVGSFWDIDTSYQTSSVCGTGRTTTEMQNNATFLDAGWDFVDEMNNGTCDYWKISPGGYPRLHHQESVWLMTEGTGTAKEPYLIRDVHDLGVMWVKPTAHYRLESSLDLSGITWSMAVVPCFDGTLDGNDHVISNLHIQGFEYLGLFGTLDTRAMVMNLGLEAVDVNGTDTLIGGLVGYNKGNITACHVTSFVTGTICVGGLVGLNYGNIIDSSSTGLAAGEFFVGGLVGESQGRIAASFSTSTTTGDNYIGGLVGRNWRGNITISYSTGKVSGDSYVGGLVGQNGSRYGLGFITSCYSTGTVTGKEQVGGLVAKHENNGTIVTSFWDTETSGLYSSDGGIGKATAEMKTADTFREAGWDFIEETANGTEDIWWINEGQGYPRLCWETAEIYD